MREVRIKASIILMISDWNINVIQNEYSKPMIRPINVYFKSLQVFSNLLDNAVKYADAERPGVIKISGYKDKTQYVYSIEDNGIGISPEHQDQIFEIFHQLEPSRVQGEGMGLTIAHRIIEKHNGKIRVESELGKGSKFIVSLPS